MKSELYLNYKKNKNIFIIVYIIFAFFSIFLFTTLFSISNFKYEHRLEIIFIILLYLLMLLYTTLWFILYNIAIKYESRNKPFPKIFNILAWFFFIPYIIFYGKEKQQVKKQIIFSAIFNQIGLALFLTLFSLFFYYSNSFKEKNIVIYYLDIVSWSTMGIIFLVRVNFFIFLFFYKKGGNKFLKFFSWILAYPKVYHKIISLNINKEYISLKVKKSKIKKIDFLFEKHSNLFIYYKKRKIWFIGLTLFFIYISVFALGSAITMNQVKYNIIFSIVSFFSLLTTVYFIIWFTLHKIAIKYENNNESFPKWLKISSRILLMNYLSKYKINNK